MFPKEFLKKLTLKKVSRRQQKRQTVSCDISVSESDGLDTRQRRSRNSGSNTQNSRKIGRLYNTFAAILCNNTSFYHIEKTFTMEANTLKPDQAAPLQMPSAYYVGCIYSNTLQKTFIIEANIMNPDQTALIWVYNVLQHRLSKNISRCCIYGRCTSIRGCSRNRVMTEKKATIYQLLEIEQ